MRTQSQGKTGGLEAEGAAVETTTRKIDQRSPEAGALWKVARKAFGAGESLMIDVEDLARDLSLEELPESRSPVLSRHQWLLHVRKTPEQAARWEAKKRALEHLLKHRKRMTVDLEKVALPRNWQNWDAIRAFRIPKAKPSEPGARKTWDLVEEVFDVKPRVKLFAN
jgi:hypothetical protein